MPVNIVRAIASAPGAAGNVNFSGAVDCTSGSYLLVFVVGATAADAQFTGTFTATYNGTNLTKIGNSTNSGNPFTSIAAFGLNAPTTGSNSLVISTTGIYTAGWTVLAYVLSDTTTSATVDVSVFSVSSTGSITPSMTTTTANCKLLLVCGDSYQSGAALTIPGSPWTEAAPTPAATGSTYTSQVRVVHRDVTVTGTYSGTFSVAFGHLAALAIAIKEAAGTVYNNSLTEAATAADAIVPNRVTAGAATETVTTGRVFSATRINRPSITETVTTGRVFSATRINRPSIAEGIASADALAGSLILWDSLVEPTASADLVQSAAQLVDTIDALAALLDTPTATLDAVNALGDGSSLQDAATAGFILSLGLTESVGSADSILAGSAFARALADATSASDAIAAAASMIAAASEGAALAELVSGLRTTRPSVSETALMADSAAAILAMQAALVEAIAAADQVAAPLAYAAVVAEAASLSDAVIASRSFANTLVEALAAADQVTNAAVFSAMLGDSAALQDVLTSQYQTNALINDAVGLNATAVGAASFLAFTSENAQIGDSLLAGLWIPVAIGDNAPVVDGALSQLIGQALAIDATTLADLVQGASVIAQQANEAVSLGDGAVQRLDMSPALAELAQLFDASIILGLVIRPPAGALLLLGTPPTVNGRLPFVRTKAFLSLPAAARPGIQLPAIGRATIQLAVEADSATLGGTKK